jgi:hypothetical protein
MKREAAEKTKIELNASTLACDAISLHLSRFFVQRESMDRGSIKSTLELRTFDYVKQTQAARFKKKSEARKEIVAPGEPKDDSLMTIPDGFERIYERPRQSDLCAYLYEHTGIARDPKGLACVEQVMAMHTTQALEIFNLAVLIAAEYWTRAKDRRICDVISGASSTDSLGDALSGEMRGCFVVFYFVLAIKMYFCPRTPSVVMIRRHFRSKLEAKRKERVDPQSDKFVEFELYVLQSLEFQALVTPEQLSVRVLDFERFCGHVV